MFLPVLTSLLVLWRPLIANTEFRFDDCGMPATCRRIANDRNPEDISESEGGLCFCDPDCFVVEDCCIDAVPNENSRLVDIAPAYWECRELAVQGRNHEMIYMVSSCPNGHPLQDQCSQTSMDYDYKLDIPVLSSYTGIWFQNIFCAICHNYTDHFRALDLSFSCNGENTTLQEVLTLGIYLPGDLTWFYEDSICVLQAQLQTSDTMNAAEPWERPCIPAVSSCPLDWQNTTIAKLCRSYAHYVESRGEIEVGKTSSDYIHFCMLMKLFTIMGLGWIMGILAEFLDQPILWYPYVVLNGLQGTFIFMSNMKCNTLIALWRRVVNRPEPQGSNIQRTADGSNSSTRTSII
ncbi:uncharacterized protein [Anabrus simplex]|uniref:uncharacterized protein isoform X5 n=1 Tax=Anabrus simplex TaxID=316456 RepID=UPI0035A34911